MLGAGAGGGGVREWGEEKGREESSVCVFIFLLIYA